MDAICESKFGLVAISREVAYSNGIQIPRKDKEVDQQELHQLTHC